MKSRLKKNDELEIHKWLGTADLSKLPEHVRFQSGTFPNLRPTNWEKLYQSFQNSKAISIRLPVQTIERLKIHAMQKGIPYQTLIRLWLSEKLEKAA